MRVFSPCPVGSSLAQTKDRIIGSHTLSPDARVTRNGAPEPAPRRLHQFFDRACDTFPVHVAVSCNGERLTYADLDKRANRLAHHLRRQGVRPGDRVGLLLERSVATYVSLLAVLKCGAAFVPLDVSFPAERIAFIAADAGLALLVTTTHFRSAVGTVCCPVLSLDTAATAIVEESPTRIVVQDDDDALCYIIYTSGTTGHPKGVAVNHSSICNFIESCTPIYGVTASDRVYQGMTLAFDFSIEEVWPTFHAGATLVAGPTDHRRLGAGLTEFLIEQKITVLACVPTLLATVERDVPTLRTLLVGGEACPADLVKQWSRPGRRMLNTYGPTETSVTATWSELVPGKPVTIGRPLPTYTAHLLDDELRPVGPGEAGEICIGGPGVAVGYVNRPELTAEKFIHDAFSDHPGARLYRTGDLGVYTADGEIEYLGRIDTQVKIRGYRIELAEIESVLLEDSAVAAAIVALVSGDGGVDELAAYVVPRRDADFGELRHRLHATLRQRLPVYMVPGYVERLEAVPMLPSNKADRSRLPRPSGPRLGRRERPETVVPPETPARTGNRRRLVAGVWPLRSAPSRPTSSSTSAATRCSRPRSSPALRGDRACVTSASPTCTHIRPFAAWPGNLEQRVASPRIQRAQQSSWTRHSETAASAPAGAGANGTLLYLLLVLWLAPSTSADRAVVHGCRFDAVGVQTAAGGVAAILAAGPLVHAAVSAGVVLKWLLLGRVRPGRYPLWGWFFCRWWLVRKLLQSTPLDLLAGSPLLAPYLRLLGARIGRGCHHG